MRVGQDHRSRGRYNANRPFRPQGNRTFESNGPGVKIRGDARQIFERYVVLAREAAVGGDPVAAENLYQHAEHYLRISNGIRGNALTDGRQPAQAGTDAAEHSQSGGDTDRPQAGLDDDRPGFI